MYYYMLNKDKELLRFLSLPFRLSFLKHLNEKIKYSKQACDIQLIYFYIWHCIEYPGSTPFFLTVS